MGGLELPIVERTLWNQDILFSQDTFFAIDYLTPELGHLSRQDAPF